MRFAELLNIPRVCAAEKTVFKKLFYENGNVSPADRRLFTENVGRIVWECCLKPGNVNIQPYQDEARDYPEAEVLSVELQGEKGIGRLAEIILRTIPYPMLLIFQKESQCQLWMVHLRRNGSDTEKVTIETPIHSNWFPESSSVWQAMNIRKCRFTNFYDFYTDWFDALSIWLAQQTASGQDGKLTGEQARAALAAKAWKEKQIADLRAELKKETQFSRKAELSMKIKELQMKDWSVTNDHT